LRGYKGTFVLAHYRLLYMYVLDPFDCYLNNDMYTLIMMQDQLGPMLIVLRITINDLLYMRCDKLL